MELPIRPILGHVLRGGGGAQWAMIPKLRIFLFLVFISKKYNKKTKNPTFFAPKISMMFADGLKIKFYLISRPGQSQGLLYKQPCDLFIN